MKMGLSTCVSYLDEHAMAITLGTEPAWSTESIRPANCNYNCNKLDLLV